MSKFKESDIVYHKTDGELLVTEVDGNAITCMDRAGDEWVYQAQTLSDNHLQEEPDEWTPTPGWWLLRENWKDCNSFPILAFLHSNGDWELEKRFLDNGEIDRYIPYASINLDNEGFPITHQATNPEPVVEDNGISAAREG